MTSSRNIHRNIVSIDATLKDVLDALNKGINGVVFLEDRHGRIQGIFTDGDVRRAVLTGAGLDALASKYMNRHFSSAPVGLEREDYIAKLSESIRHLPILDEQGRLVDFVSWVEIWKRPVMEPSLGGNELKYVSDCVASNWISSQGQYVRGFEKAFASHHGMPFGVAVMNCTCALHMALVALGVGPGDEVLVPDLTFAASANAVIHAGAVPVLVDVDPVTWTMDPAAMERAVSSRTKAVMPVHLYGHPCDMDPVLEIAAKAGLAVVEDCAEALGARYKDRLVGTFGHAACFSFFSNKVITTGEGGMVLTRDSRLHERLKMLRDHGMSPAKKYWHETVGFNYRMTNLQAAIGMAQLERIGGFLERRAWIAGCYEDNLRKLSGLTLPPRQSWAQTVMWLFTVLLPDAPGIERDEVIRRMSRSGIETRPIFYPLHVQPPYAPGSGNYPASDAISRRGISLPSSVDLQRADIEYICRQLSATVEDLKREYQQQGQTAQ